MSTGWRDPFQEKKEPFKANPKSLDGVPDLCMLTYLGEENVLYNLGYRYKQGNIYTSTTSKVLIAVNPYERMDHFYTNELMEKYQAAEINLEGIQGEKDLPPHVYTVSNSAFQNMIAKKQNQSIIVCGESGSGKTESAKYQMRFLAFTTTSGAKDQSEFEAADKVGQQVLDANPILESFGNAKTLLNNNSSRFGKFTKMLFEEVKVSAGQKPRRKLVGAIIETYLLEKSRVVKQDKGERTFHIFYQLTYHHKGHEDLPALKLGPAEQFHYTNQSGVHTLDDLRFPGKAADGEWFKELMHAFRTLNIPRTETDDVFRVVSGVLHLGNINFEQLKGEGSEVKEKDEMAVAAEMFQVPVAGLEKRLKTRSILLPGDKLIVKPLNEPDAVFNRDSCSRNLYNGLFRWIVSRINKQSSATEGPATTWIGILDVFGFEIFKHNSFEQFCINFANERLQQYFNEHVLKAEQELYKREALLWDPIDLPDNQDCIDLVMSKPYGILPILDSTCVQPKGTDQVFTANLFKAHKYHPRLREVKQHKKSDSDKQFTAMNGFVIRHYAGAVLYDCAEFLIKNADASEFDTVELFLESKSQLATELLRITADGKIEDGKRSTKRSFRSTGTVFAEQLDSLMKTLKQTAPYFVRCIKPNPNKAPKDFQGEYVRPQLRCGGLIEALRIIKLGFPTRCAYKRVHELFLPILKDQKPMPNLNIRDFTEAIMFVCGDKTKKLNFSDYQLGLTMVFFRPGCQTYLTDILEKKPEAVTAPQRIAIRKFMVKKRWIRGRGTVRAVNICGKMLSEMRFKKAALTMVLIYRTVGRALNQARYLLDGKRREAEAERKARDEAFLQALKAAEELKRAAAQKAEMEASLRKMAEENQRALAEKDEQAQRIEDKIRETMEKLRQAEEKAMEAQKKQLKLYEESNAKKSELQSQLSALSDERDRTAAQARSLDNQLQAKNEELAAKEREIVERSGQIDSLKREVNSYKSQIEQIQESGENAVSQKERDLNEKKEELEAERNKIKSEIREREAQVTELRAAVLDTEKKLAGLKEQAEAKEKENEAKSKEYNSQLEEANKRVSEFKGDIDTLRKRLEDVKSQADAQARTSTEELKSARQAARDEQAKLERSIADKEHQAAKLGHDLSVLKAQADAQAKSHSETLHQEREEARERFEIQEKIIAEKETSLNSTRRELALVSGKLDAAVADHSELSARTSTQLAEQKEKIEEFNEKSEKNIRKLDSKIASVQSEVALYKDRLDNANRELKHATQSNEDAKNTFDRQMKEKDSLIAETKSEVRKFQTKYDQAVQSMEDKTALLQEQLNARRTQERESQEVYEKELYEKNRELGEVKSEAELLKGRLAAEKERAATEKKQAEQQLSEIKTEADTRVEKLEAELKFKVGDLAELKADYKKKKGEWKETQESFEKKIASLEKEIEAKQDQITVNINKLSLLERTSKAATDELTSTHNRKETKYLQQVYELKSSTKELHSRVAELQAEVAKAARELEVEKQSAKDKEQKYSDELEKRKVDAERLEKEFSAYKAEVGTANEAKVKALTGLVETLKVSIEDEKRDKEEAKKREEEYRTRLKVASAQVGEALSELKHIPTTHSSELEKLRVELDISRKKHVLESQAWRDQANSYDRQLIEKITQISELKADLAELTEREQAASSALKQKTLRSKHDLSELKAVNKELEAEYKQWLENQSEYEAQLTAINLEILEAKAALAEVHRKREESLHDLKVELEILHAELEAEKRISKERELEFEKELSLHKEKFSRELQRLNAKQERAVAH